jgi:hypothetical protein
MEFLHASLALLASMVLVLAGMVGWLYWQQTRLFQNMNSIIMVIGELARPPPVPEPVEDLTELVGLSEKVSDQIAELKPEDAPKEDDDRASVEPEAPKTEIVEGPPAPLDTDGLESKSKKELQELLTKRGIPFGKQDTKSGLITLLKATA